MELWYLIETFYIFFHSTIAYTDAITNQGKQFITVFGDNGIYKNEPLQMVQLYITTSHTDPVAVNVTSSPYFATTSINYHFSVSAAEFRRLDISMEFRLVGNEYSNKGIIVEADNDIVVFGYNREIYSVDLFLVLPLDSLGVEYYTVSYYPPYTVCQIQVVGVYDNTDVKIKLTNNSNAVGLSFKGINYLPGDTILLCVDELDTIQLQTTGDVSGTYISSNKPIAVLSGNKKVSIGSSSGKDHMSEQLRPVNTWGKHFVLASNPISSKGDIFKTISCEYNTKVTVNCMPKSGDSSSIIRTLNNPGDFWEIVMQDGQNCVMNSSKPVFVTQMFRNIDPSMIIIPPVEQYSNSYTFVNPKEDGFTLRLQVAVDKSKTTDLRLNGKPVQIQFSVVESFAIGHVDIVENTNTIVMEGPTVVNFSALMFGDMKYETYGTAAGINLHTIHDTGSTFSGGVCYTPTAPSAEPQEKSTALISTSAAPPLMTPSSGTSSTATTTTAFLSNTEDLTSSSAASWSTLEAKPTTTTISATDIITAESTKITTTTGPVTSTRSTDISTAEKKPTTAAFSIPVMATSILPTNSNLCCEYYHCYSEVDITVKIEELRILRKDTVRYKLSLISINDNRPSARAIGYSGGIMIAVVFLSIIIVDLPNLKRMICLMRKNIGCSSTIDDDVMVA